MTYDKKSIGPVISFIIWLALFAVICIIGISNVFAASYDANSYTAQLYDNYGPSLHPVTTEFSNMSWRGTIPSMTANTSGAAWGISSPIPLLSNRTYSMTVKIEGTYGGNITLSTYNRIGVGTSLSNAKSSYENNTNCTLNYSNSIPSNMILQFAFTPKINSNYIVFPFATTYSGENQSFYLYDIIIDDLGSSGVNETTINNSLNNQTNEINNSITNSTNTITGEINNMEQSIIDSNKETQEVIKDQFNTCSSFSKDFTFNDANILKSYLDKDGNIITSAAWGVVEYFPIHKNIDYIFYSNKVCTNCSFCLYDSNKSLISCTTYSNRATINFNSHNANYFSFSIPSNGSLKLTADKICINKLDEQNETSKGIFGKIKELFSWLTNPEPADISGAGDVAGWLPSGPLDSLINLPLTMLTNINSSLNKTCSPLNVNLPYVNKSVEIPCLNTIFNQITGLNSFWTWVGMIGSVMILYRYLVNLYKYYDHLTDLQANFISDWGSI